MNETANAFRAGLVVLAGVAVAIYFFAQSRKSTLNELNSEPYYAYMTDASGLSAKSLITVAGLQIGEIQDITLRQVSVEELLPNPDDRSEALYPKQAGFIPDGSTVARWLKKPGDQVEPEEVLVVLSTERGELDVKSPLRGLLLGIERQEGDPVAYETRLGVVGLNPKDPVKVARVDMRVSNDVQVPTDSWLKKESLGLLGAKALFLELGADKTLVEPEGRIHNVRSKTQFDTIATQVEELVTSIRDIVGQADENITRTIAHVESIADNINKFIEGDEENPPLDELYEMVVTDVRDMVNSIKRATKDINRVVNKNDEAVTSLLANLERISKDVEDLTKPLTPGVDGGPPTGGEIRETMANVQKITDDLQVVTGALKDAVGEEEGNFGESIKKMKASLDQLNTSLENLSEITGRIERGEGTVGKLLTDEKLADRMESAAVGAAELVESVTSLETYIDLGTWYSVRRGKANVALGLRIQPNPDKFYLVEVVNDGGAFEQLTRVVNSVENTPGGLAFVRRESTWYDDNTLRFTAMFAKRFFEIVILRAGLIETSGGVGADLFLWDDRIQLRNDFFNFGGPRNQSQNLNDPAYPLFTLPRWRATLKVQPVPYVYLSAGFDDILNMVDYERMISTGDIVYIDPAFHRYGTDFFIGVGIMFKDDDLRGLLPFIPSF